MGWQSRQESTPTACSQERALFIFYFYYDCQFSFLKCREGNSVVLLTGIIHKRSENGDNPMETELCVRERGGMGMRTRQALSSSSDMGKRVESTPSELAICKICKCGGRVGSSHQVVSTLSEKWEQGLPVFGKQATFSGKD